MGLKMNNNIRVLRPTIAEIDLNAIRANVETIRLRIGPRPRIIATVKANAYGHGAVPVSKAVLEAGANELSVATIEEAIELREAGIQAPILMLGVLTPDAIPEILSVNVIPTVCDEAFAAELSRFAVGKGAEVPVHVKVDTGMGRIGVKAEEAPGLVAEIARMPGLRVEGIFTHFACSDDEDKSFSRHQIAEFSKIDDALKRIGVKTPVSHAANSAAIIDLPDATFDAVRPGIMIYGLYPSPAMRSRIVLKQAMTLKTKVVFMKRVEPGVTISYGRTFAAKRRSLIATIPIGYADGLNRLLSNKGKALVRGRRAPIAGRVCMDQTMLDVTDIPGASVGDEVVLYGRQGEEMISIESVAGQIGTISYEVVCAVSARVPRVYVGE
jgi:alanine racemase